MVTPRIRLPGLMIACLSALAPWAAPASAALIPTVVVNTVADNPSLQIGQTTTVHVTASITNPTSGSDGIAAYDLNVNLLPSNVVHIVPGSLSFSGSPVALGGPTFPNSTDSNNPGGITGIAELYVSPDNLGIGSPFTLFSFQIMADKSGVASVGISSGAQTGLGDVFALVQGDSLNTDFTNAIANVQVASVPEPASCLLLADGLLCFSLRRATKRH